MVFANVVDALNYLAHQGWLFVNTDTDAHGQRYLLRRALISTGK